MTHWHGYFGIENLNLSNAQRDNLHQALQQIGPEESNLPAELLHWRIRPDNQAIIYEARFDDAVLTVNAFKNYLAGVFAIDPATIDHDTSSVLFEDLPTPIVVFSRSGTDYLRLALFAGPGSSWEQSLLETLRYIKDNLAQWEAS